MKNTGRYLLILILLMVMWDSKVIKPLKIFTVFLHELGHSLMAVVFGSGIQSIRINPDESGYAITQPDGWFSAFMIANGGYMGSLLFALLILYLKRTPYKKYILGTAAIVLLGISLKFADSFFTLLYSFAFAAGVLALYMLQNDKLNDWVIDIIGISSVAYAIYDTFVDTILLQINIQLHLIQGWKGQQPMTDAFQLSQMTGLPAMVWGIIWLCVSLAAVNALLIKAPVSRR